MLSYCHLARWHDHKCFGSLFLPANLLKYTTARKASASEHHKSAITDHVAYIYTNHIIYWEKAKTLDSKPILKKDSRIYRNKKKGGFGN